jgi:hypothetical protein
MKAPMKQQGMSAYQILILVILGLFIAFTGIKLVPIYGEYMSVTSSMQRVQESNIDDPGSPRSLQRELQRHLRINSVNNVEADNIHISPEGDGYLMRVSYEVRTGWIGNVDLVVSFENEVKIGR